MARGFSTRSFWTADPLPLKGFQCSSSGHVLVLWLEVTGGVRSETVVQLDVKVLSLSHTSAAWLVVLVYYLCKAMQYLVRNKIGPIWAGSAVTQLTLHIPRFYIRGFSQPQIKNNIFNLKIGLTICIILYIILYMGLEHPRIFVSAGSPGTSLPQILRKELSFGGVKSHMQVFDCVGGLVPLTPILSKVSCNENNNRRNCVLEEGVFENTQLWM